MGWRFVITLVDNPDLICKFWMYLCTETGFRLSSKARQELDIIVSITHTVQMSIVYAP